MATESWKSGDPGSAATPQPPTPHRRAPGLTYSDNLCCWLLGWGLLFPSSPRSLNGDRGGERRLGHPSKKLPVASSRFSFGKWKELRKDVPLYQPLRYKGADAGLPGASSAHPGEVREKSGKRSKIAFIPPTQSNCPQIRSTAPRARNLLPSALAKAPGAQELPGQVNSTTRGSRSYQSINLFALTSSLSPYPGGVVAANVFHKVQSDKKPRNQSQLHSNPLRVRLLLFVLFLFPF